MICLSELKAGGTFLLNCAFRKEELAEKLPPSVCRALQKKRARFYTIDATRIARELGLGNHTNLVLQAAFFALSGVLPLDEAIASMKEEARKTYLPRGTR